MCVVSYEEEDTCSGRARELEGKCLGFRVWGLRR
jgi:hypothetical protein